MGSGLVFLCLLQLHYYLDWTTLRGNKLICNNEGLLIRIETTLQWAYLQPNVTLRAEWDIESVILEAYRAITGTFAFTHVKSHQDGSTPLAD